MDLKMRKFFTVLVLAAGLALGGCGDAPEPVEVMATETITHTVKPSTSTSESPTSTTPSAAPATEPAQAAADSAPYVVECLEGTPGPALWSDGSTRYSEECFQNLGGPEYLDQESQSVLQSGGAAVTGYGYAPNGARNPSSGEIQAYHGCQDGYITDPALCAGAEAAVRAADPNGELYG